MLNQGNLKPGKLPRAFRGGKSKAAPTPPDEGGEHRSFKKKLKVSPKEPVELEREEPEVGTLAPAEKKREKPSGGADMVAP